MTSMCRDQSEWKVFFTGVHGASVHGAMHLEGPY